MNRPSLLSILLVAAAVVAGAGGLAAQAPDDADRMFLRARTKAFVEGKLDEAIKLYAEIAATYNGNHALAARALVQMADCYEKLGQNQARDVYERIVREYGDQPEAVKQARDRLAALGARSAQPAPRLVAKAGGFLRFSPDRRWVIRLSPLGPQELRDEQTGKVRSLGTAGCFGFPFSPDSHQVAFECSAGGTVELRVAAVAGGAERVVWRGGEPLGALQWFPDGKRILGTGEQPGKTRLVAVSVADGTTTTLGELPDTYGSPQLSPDGKSVIYVPSAEYRAQTKLVIKDVADGKEATFFEWPSAIYSPAWTPDGTGVVFLSDRREPGKSADLWLLRAARTVASGIPELLARDLGGIDALGRPTIWPLGSITPGGAYYYVHAGGELVQVLLAPFDAQTGKVTGAPSFVSRRGGISRSPSFSADGRWLSYVSQDLDLDVKSLESGEEKVVPITPAPTKLDWAVMFPDGRSFVVQAVHPKEGKGIYRVDAATGAWSSLTKPGEARLLGFPNAISPNGRTFFYTRWPDPNAPANELVARDIDTGSEQVLSRGSHQLFALSLDGAQMAVTRSDGKDLIVEVMPATGGPKNEIYRAHGFERADVTWTSDGRSLLISPADASNNAKSLLRLSIADGSVQQTGILVGECGRTDFPCALGATRMNPTGRQLAYTARGKGGVEEWVLENVWPRTAAKK